MPILTGLRRRLPFIQRTIMSRVHAEGVTQEAAASHLDCSPSRVSFWTASKWRPMTVEDLLGLIEVSGDANMVLRPMLEACGLVAVERPEGSAGVFRSWLAEGLAVGADAGAFQRRLAEALADDELTNDELDELEEHLQCLADRVATMRASFRALRSGDPSVVGLP